MKTIITLLLTLATSASFAETVICQTSFGPSQLHQVSFDKDDQGNITEARSSGAFGAYATLVIRTCESTNYSNITTCSREYKRLENGNNVKQTIVIVQTDNKFAVTRTSVEQGRNGKELAKEITEFNNCQ